MSLEMLMLLRFAKVQCSCWVVSQESKDFAQSKSIASEKTSGLKLHQWRTRDITWVHALLAMTVFMHLEDSSEAQNKRSMTALNSMKSIRTCGKSSLWEWRILYGHAVLWLFPPLKFFWLEVRTPTEMAKSIFSTSILKIGSRFTTWINWECLTSLSSFKTKSLWLVVTMICRARFMTLKKTSGVLFLHITPY